MSDLSFARFFRLRSGGIECDADGLRVGGYRGLNKIADRPGFGNVSVIYEPN